ncbi:hypothetical protein [uncultured Methylobacterium sp.]|uniref:hypothetical protein n=1 Tax=uncultured Methylobacterium sp. TaxID=157278 RepID=UPI0035C96660
MSDLVEIWLGVDLDGPAAQLLASGVHPKIAPERLEHSSVGITLDFYSPIAAGDAGGCSGQG